MTCGDSEQWLLDCLNGPAPIPREPIEQFGESQWQALVNAAARHGLRPLLYERLATPSDSLKIPEAVLRELRESYLKNGLRNQLLYRDLARVLGELREDGIPVIVLKGAHLAALVYPRMALRVMGDIDLLVKRADLKQAASRLRQLGYAFETEVDIEAFLTGFPPPMHLPPLFKPPHPRIELHWRIDPAQPLQEELDLWQRARPARLAGVDTLVLAPEDLVLHLCLHGGSHHLLELGLRPLCDLTRHPGAMARGHRLAIAALAGQEVAGGTVCVFNAFLGSRIGPGAIAGADTAIAQARRLRGTVADGGQGMPKASGEWI